MKILVIVISLLLCISQSLSQETEVDENSNGLYQIEGKVYNPEAYDSENKNWIDETDIIVNNGNFFSYFARLLEMHVF